MAPMSKGGKLDGYPQANSKTIVNNTGRDTVRALSSVLRSRYFGVWLECAFRDMVLDS